MILLDKALEKRHLNHQPIRVGLVGAGFMGSRLAVHLLKQVRGMKLVAIANRHVEPAWQAFQQAGAFPVREAKSLEELEDCIARNVFAVVGEAEFLCQSTQIDVLIEVTGTVEFAARIVLAAIRHHKHVIMMNAELDGTLGPILKHYADQAGVIISNADGDQPGAIMNLLRSIQGMGFTPLLCANIKGLLDPYRTPATQRGFAEKWGQNPGMLTSFADGSKMAFEMAVVANATGMGVGQRGMFGPVVPEGTPIEGASQWFPMEKIMEGPGIVDYVLGASPAPGVFVLASVEGADNRRCMDLFKMGPGPAYCFYTPYHLCHFEVPFTIARAVLFEDAAIAPKGGSVVGVICIAKRDLKAGEVLDGIGGFMAYGQCENADIISGEGFLLHGLSEGCTLKRDIAKDQVIACDDVERPPHRVGDRLEAEQRALYG